MKLIISNSQIKEIAAQCNVGEHDIRAREAYQFPTERQKAAGNYKMGHIKLRGFPITIENPAGSKRYWKDKDGREGYTVMQNHYGYFVGTEGKDGDEVDVFIGPYVESVSKIYVVDQYQMGEFDESKVMFGFSSMAEAKQAYFANYDANWRGFKYITGVTMEIFKEWLYRGRKQKKPFREYALIEKNRILSENKKKA